MNLTKLQNQAVRELIQRLEAEQDTPLTSLEELAIEEGVRKGLRQGIEQGLQQGRQEGLQQGLRDGLVRATLRLLQTRFGEDALRLKDRLAQIESIEQLETLTTEAAFAPSLEAFEQKLG
jgi:flagellar biosynthesis/type III secretory pathway protein FliH